MPGFFINFCLYHIYCSVEVFVEFTVTMKYLLDLISRGGTLREALRFVMFILFLVMLSGPPSWKITRFPPQKKS